MYFVYVSFSDNLNNFLDIKFMSKGQVNGSIRNNSILLIVWYNRVYCVKERLIRSLFLVSEEMYWKRNVKIRTNRI